jgi:Zn-dependent protease
LALVTSLLFFVSVLAHELAHSLISKAQGVAVPRTLAGGNAHLHPQVLT